jgi:hypothetical protein
VWASSIVSTVPPRKTIESVMSPPAVQLSA